MNCVCLIAMLFGSMEVPSPMVADRPLVMAAHTYEARIRLDGRVSTTRVQASDAGQAKKLVRAQFGPTVTVLSVKRID
jgi:hypothetical protein